MNATIIITAVVVLASLALSVAALRLWRTVLPVDNAMPRVQVLGAYSPVLTWLKYGRFSLTLPRSKLPAETKPPPMDTTLLSENELLKQRVAELEAQVAELKTDAQPAQRWSWDRARAWPLVRPLLLLSATLVLAAVPSWLVVQQTWFDNQALANRLRDGWCRVNYLCALTWPAYFWIIFLCVAAVVALVVLDRRPLPVFWQAGALAIAAPAPDAALAGQGRWSRWLLAVSAVGLVGTVVSALIGQRPPGLAYAFFIGVYVVAWLVAQAPFKAAAAWWHEHSAAALALLLAHVALIGVLASYYGHPSMLWGLALLLVAALANLLRYRRQVHPLFWIISAALVLYTIRIDAWWFSVVGDEYSFFKYAREIASGQTFNTFGYNFFSGTAVYATHPYLSSVIQALSMKLLGLDNFGWRFSSLYLSALSIGLFYYFSRAFVQRRVALLAAVLLAASHYVMSFGKIGYNNLQALFALGLVLAACAWALRTRRLLAYVSLGLAGGFCFYVYPAAFYALPLPVLLLWLYDRPRSRATWRAWGLAALTVLVLIVPLLLQPGYWESKVFGTLLYNPDLTRTIGTVINHFTTNLLYAFFAIWYIPEPSHFVSVSYLDPVSVVFVLIGLACLLRQARRERFAGFLVLSFGLLLFLVGASHDRLYPSATRMFMLLPWWTLMAALGLVWLQRALGDLGLRRLARGALLAAVLAVILGLNLYQAYGLAYQHALGRAGLENMFLKLAQDVQAVEGDRPKTFVFVTDPEWGIDGLYMLQNAYGAPSSPAQLTKITVSTPTLSEADLLRLADPQTLIILKPWLPEDWQQALGSQLAALGKEGCPVNRPNSQVPVFVLWHAPELAGLCP